jgi:S-adenosylmethionine uptake transporter
MIAVVFVTARDLATRKMSAQTPSMMVTLSASVGVMLFFGAGALTEPWVDIAVRDMALIVGASVFIIGGYLFSVMVMRVGEVSFIAPFRYTGLLWALLLGLVLFGDWPDPLTLLGAAVVVASGVFTLYRERQVARRSRT